MEFFSSDWFFIFSSSLLKISLCSSSLFPDLINILITHASNSLVNYFCFISCFIRVFFFFFSCSSTWNKFLCLLILTCSVSVKPGDAVTMPVSKWRSCVAASLCSPVCPVALVWRPCVAALCDVLVWQHLCAVMCAQWHWWEPTSNVNASLTPPSPECPGGVAADGGTRARATCELELRALGF